MCACLRAPWSPCSPDVGANFAPQCESCSEGSALFMNQAYWPNLWPWRFLFLFPSLSLFSFSLRLSLCPPAGAYCEPAWLERRAHSDWTKRYTHHWAALPTSPHSSLSLDAAGVCVCVCVCMCRGLRSLEGSNKSTCLSTTSSLPPLLSIPPLLLLPPPSSFYSLLLSPPSSSIALSISLLYVL